MQNRVTCLLAALIALSLAACAGHATNAVSATDRGFMIGAAKANADQIAQAKIELSLTKGAAHAYALQMIADHTKLQAGLQDIAAKTGLGDYFKQGLRVTAPPVPLTAREYLAGAYGVHRRLVNLMNTQIQFGTNSSLDDWAKAALPMMQAHADLAERESKS